MQRYVAFLRGINVGGRVVKMADLKSCMETLGFRDIKTVLQTGNVIFEAPEQATGKLEKVLEKGIGEAFNYPARVLVRNLAEVGQVINEYPFDSVDDNFQHYILFLKEGVIPSQLAEEAADMNVEAVKAGNGVVYWQVQKGMTLKSVFAKHLAKAKYKELHTARNLKTLQKTVL